MTNKETKKIAMHESWRWEEDEYKSCGTNFKLVEQNLYFMEQTRGYKRKTLLRLTRNKNIWKKEHFLN
jgi:hypothetical protein